MGKNVQKHSKNSFYHNIKDTFSKYGNINFLKKIVFTSDYLLPVSVLLILGEVVLSVLIVQKVKYTEIDWNAYMQEAEGFINGTLDYSELKGDTGPLVYPAGFVYIYSILYYITDKGTNIRCAQYLFVAFYIILLYLVFRIYIRTKKVPAYVLAIMCCTSYRIHSIFMLRLFNDPIAMILLYASINLLLDNYWTIGSLVYSLAVSVKMNILLFSPALLLGYLVCLGFKQTVIQLCVCGCVQLVLGLPFIIENPSAYLKGSFDLGRVFFHKWTVNWRFLPESIFINPYFHLALLTAHICVLCVFFKIAYTYINSYARLKCIECDIKKTMKNQTKIDMSSTSQLFILPLFLANFIGVVFSRSLHYQFYIWYYHSLPYLLWTTRLPVVTKLTLLGFIELGWNTYPSTEFSSVLLHAAHLIILYNLYQTTKTNIKVE